MKIKLDTRKIFLAMAEKGLSGTDLAKECGVSQQCISSVLCGKTVGKKTVVPGICKVLGFTAKEIVIIED